MNFSGFKLNLVSLFIFCCILISLSGCSGVDQATTSELYPYYEKASRGFKVKYIMGYVDPAGKLVVKPQFLKAHPFTEGLGCVSFAEDENKPAKFGYIDSTGNWVIPPTFSEARPFHEGVALVQETPSSKYGFINRKGEFITSQIYEEKTTDMINGSSIGYVYTGTTTESNLGDVIVAIFTLGMAGGSRTYSVHNVYNIFPDGDTSMLSSRTVGIPDTAKIKEYDQCSGLYPYYEFAKSPRLYGYRKVTYAEFLQNPDELHLLGTIVMEPQFKFAGEFEYGRAEVVFSDKTRGFIDTTGKVLVRYKDDRGY